PALLNAPAGYAVIARQSGRALARSRCSMPRRLPVRVTPKLLLSCASALLLASAACVANAASAVVHDDAGRFGYQMNAATPSQALHWAVSYCARHSPRCTNVVTTDRPGYSAIYLGRNAV